MNFGIPDPDAPLVAQRHLMRSASTPVVHRDTCHATKRKNSQFRPWIWADRSSRSEVIRALGTPWNRPCRQCLPGMIKRHIT